MTSKIDTRRQMAHKPWAWLVTPHHASAVQAVVATLTLLVFTASIFYTWQSSSEEKQAEVFRISTGMSAIAEQLQRFSQTIAAAQRTDKTLVNVTFPELTFKSQIDSYASVIAKLFGSASKENQALNAKLKALQFGLQNTNQMLQANDSAEVQRLMAAIDERFRVVGLSSPPRAQTGQIAENRPTPLSPLKSEVNNVPPAFGLSPILRSTIGPSAESSRIQKTPSPAPTSAANATSTANQTASSASCKFSLDNAIRNIRPYGGMYSTSLTSSDPNCIWAAQSNTQFVTNVLPLSGKGNGVINYTVEPNTVEDTRSGTLSIAGQLLTLIQYSLVIGCMDPTATNYNKSATDQIGVTCTYPKGRKEMGP